MMKGYLLITSLLLSTLLLAENDLGYPISKGSTHSDQQNAPQSKNYSKTVVNTHKTFKKDHHRYDKRYQNFNYDDDGYYNNDGYYYGYFDRRGYFFNNIFFTYNDEYTYSDRQYRRGYFRPHYTHHRRHHYHHDNHWNREHCYRQPNHIVVYEHYYEQPYPPMYRRDHSNYNHRDTARMTLPNRNSNHQSTHRDNHIRDNNYRDSSYRDNNSRHYNQNYNHRDTARMTTHRNSSTQQRNPSSRDRSNHPKQHRSNSAHMQISR